MLAFNLGVFFRNLSGAEVEFTAHNADCDVVFVGRVRDIREELGLGSTLQVTLSREPLQCRIEIEDSDGEEDESPGASPEPAIEVILEREAGERAEQLFRGRFTFEAITLKPYVPHPPPEAPDAGTP